MSIKTNVRLEKLTCRNLLNLFLTALCFCALTNKANAQTGQWYCGAQGNNLIATTVRDLSRNNAYIVTITGRGDMMDYDANNPSPWMENPVCTNPKARLTVIIGDSVTSIGNNAFYMYSCFQVDSVKIGNSVTRIGNEAFVHNTDYLTSITMPNSVISIGSNAFLDCSKLTSVTLSNNLTTIGIEAFFRCSRIKTITIPNSVTTIGNGAFKESGLSSVTVPGSVANLGDGVFYFCYSLTSATFLNGVTSIGSSTFHFCYNLTSVTLPNSITSIGYCSFYYCDNLLSITIPSSVTSIGQGAFYNCNQLTSITCKAKIPPGVGSYAFDNVPKNIPVYVPCKSLSAYQSPWRWGGFSNFVPVSEDTTFYSAVKCYNVPYTDANFTTPIHSTGTYYRTLSVGGCDSVVCLSLSSHSAVSVTNYSRNICYGGTYTDANFRNLSVAGTYYDTLRNRNGCDSVVCLTLGIYPAVSLTNYSGSICQGSTYTDVNFENLTEAGTYYDTLQNRNGCDSVVSLTLSVSNVTLTNYWVNVCYGETYTDAHFNNLSVSGTYYDTLYSTEDCDSVIRLYFTVYPQEDTVVISDAVCYGTDYTLHGFTIINATANGTYFNNDLNANGCERVTRLELTVYQEQDIIVINDTIFDETDYHLNGFNIIGAANGTYFNNDLNANGCDSVTQLNLTVIKTVRIAEWKMENEKLKIYPNPTNGQLRIENYELRENEVIAIYDIVGRKAPLSPPEGGKFSRVYSPLSEGVGEAIIIDISHLEKGLYFFKIDGKTIKFVKE